MQRLATNGVVAIPEIFLQNLLGLERGSVVLEQKISKTL